MNDVLRDSFGNLKAKCFEIDERGYFFSRPLGLRLFTVYELRVSYLHEIRGKLYKGMISASVMPW